MKRWAFNLFCLFSLLVFVSSVTLWVRSEFRGDNVWYQRQPTAQSNDVYRALSGRGWLCIAYDHSEYGQPVRARHGLGYYGNEWPGDVHIANVFTGGVDFWLAGFQIVSGPSKTSPDRTNITGIVVPLWLFLPAAVPPFLWWRKWRKKDTRGFPVSVTAEKQMQSMATEAQRHREEKMEPNID